VTGKLSYDGQTALICAQLSDLAYKLPYQIRLRTNGIVGKAIIAIKTIQHGNLRVLTITTNTSVYIVFRGTDFSNKKSRQANILFLKKNWMKGKVHRGFLGLLDHAKIFYKPKVKQQINQTKNIYFTGHSQGGAVAFLAAMDNTRPASTAISATNYTFGQPRTGDKQFCRNAESRLGGDCLRITNNCDIVVGLPMVWQGYDHIRDYLHYNSRGALSRRHQRAGARWWNGFPSGKDHRMKNYLEASRKNIHVSV